MDQWLDDFEPFDRKIFIDCVVEGKYF